MPEEIYSFPEVTWPFIYKGVHYCISYMSGEDRDRYLTELSKRTSNLDIAGAENPQLAQNVIMNMDGWSTLLLPYCTYLYNPTSGTRGELIPASTISMWPSRLIDILITKAGEITGTGATAVEENSTKKE